MDKSKPELSSCDLWTAGSAAGGRRPAGAGIRPGVLLALCGWAMALCLAFLFVFPVGAAPSAVSPGPEEDDVLYHLKRCQRSMAYLEDADCAALFRPPQGIIPSSAFTREIRPKGYVKGLYITYYGLASSDHRTRVQSLLEETELNAIVMDIKGDRAMIPYSSTVQLAADIGASPRPVIEDWPTWMAWF